MKTSDGRLSSGHRLRALVTGGPASPAAADRPFTLADVLAPAYPSDLVAARSATASPGS